MPDAPDPLFLAFQAAIAGRYSLERELGRGGMGVVYLAREVRLDRPVAVKMLPPAKARDAALRERFLREARTAAKLSHPHIVPIYAVDDVGEFVFFAMAYVEGETLAARVNGRGPLSPTDAARVLREVAWALAYAHAQGVIHRDVKPDNIMLETATGRALVADFGIAGLVQGAAGLDGGEIVGTPEFMSPEQCLGERVDARSDLYSLGVVGYFALTGRLPFQAAQATEVLAKQVTEAAPSLAKAADGAPRKLVQAIERCLAKDAAERPQHGEDLAEQFGLALERRKEVPVALRVFVRRHQHLGGLALLYLWALGLVSGLVGGLTDRFFGWETFAFGVTAGPVLMLFFHARRLVKAGFGADDVAAGFRQELERGREERTFQYGSKPSAYEWAVRVITTDLGLAREVADEVNRLLEGRREIEMDLS
jgi:eukaryotic-like serine/threonine-protein kinase